MKKPCICGKKHETWYSCSPDVGEPETEWGHEKFSLFRSKVKVKVGQAHKMRSSVKVTQNMPCLVSN